MGVRMTVETQAERSASNHFPAGSGRSGRCRPRANTVFPLAVALMLLSLAGC